MAASFPIFAARAAIVFDLDGTLVDSLPDMLGALNKLLADLARRPVTLAEARGWVGDGARLLVERALHATGGIPQGQTVEALMACYLAHYRGHAALQSRPYPGVIDTLHALHGAGHHLAICTNKPQDLAVELLDALGLSALFLAVLGGDSLSVRKPDPRHLMATLDAMGANPARALMVGDSANDVKAARGAGVPVVVVSFGYAHTAPAELGADAVIDTFAELPAVAARLV
jgi:phosphoglycolate phosphatase